MRHGLTIQSSLYGTHKALSISLDDLAVALASLDVEQIDYVKAEALRIRSVQRGVERGHFQLSHSFGLEFDEEELADFPHVLTEDFDAEGR